MVGDLGIYEAVQRDCPESDKRRLLKPDGAWLARVGEFFPGAISFWTEEGLRRNRSSGLLAWHCSVAVGVIEVITTERPEAVLYEDALQVICGAPTVGLMTQEPLAQWECRNTP